MFNLTLGQRNAYGVVEEKSKGQQKPAAQGPLGLARPSVEQQWPAGQEEQLSMDTPPMMGAQQITVREYCEGDNGKQTA